MPVRTEVLRPSAKSGLVTKRSRDLAGTAFSMAARTSSAMWPSTTTTSTACDASAAFDGMDDQRLRRRRRPAACWGRPCGVERPAASTSTATRGACCGPRLRRRRRRAAAGGVGISASRPPAPMRTISARPTGRPAASRSSTMSKPLYLGDLAQPGRPSTGLPSSSASQQQVAGIDRHAEMDDLAARLLDAGRHDVVAVDDRRGAGDQVDVAALAFSSLERAGDRLGVVRRPAFADQRAAERRSAACRSCRPPCPAPCRACRAAGSAPGRRASA